MSHEQTGGVTRIFDQAGGAITASIEDNSQGWQLTPPVTIETPLIIDHQAPQDKMLFFPQAYMGTLDQFLMEANNLWYTVMHGVGTNDHLPARKSIAKTTTFDLLLFFSHMQ